MGLDPWIVRKFERMGDVELQDLESDNGTTKCDTINKDRETGREKPASAIQSCLNIVLVFIGEKLIKAGFENRDELVSDSIVEQIG
ncbi:hypothetical protein E6O75_ATG10440 [Venturia nashicola]|uniref:Uncharacterized protein n=1 Tax=Venturia nashicola TaxID=86259 RepID=A0A4Z1P8X6_9PEZI|nr:hypothetical protein E6O75_ATG10440 [Venturia nashicola]